MRLATVFSGIGAIEQALIKQNIQYDIVFACDTGERYINIDENKINDITKNMSPEEKQTYIKNLYKMTKKRNYVKEAYFANYEITEDKWYDDIRFIDGSKYKNKVDMIVGGSPCQPFSIIGRKSGLEDARGTLFYDYARLIKEIQPKVFIFENVVGLTTHDKGNTFKVVKDVFESLNYDVYSEILNSKNFSIPQDRKRIFLVGIRNDLDTGSFKFPVGQETKLIAKDFLEEGTIKPHHYLGKKGFEFVTNVKYKNRARINKEIIQTQKANQEYNWNGDFIFEPLEKVKDNKEIMDRAYIGEWNGQKGVIRQLTYRECLRLMGFSDDFKIVVPNVQAYRQAGNSIVVNVLEEIVKEIMSVVNLNEEN